MKKLKFAIAIWAAAALAIFSFKKASSNNNHNPGGMDSLAVTKTSDTRVTQPVTLPFSNPPAVMDSLHSRDSLCTGSPYATVALINDSITLTRSVYDSLGKYGLLTSAKTPKRYAISHNYLVAVPTASSAADSIAFTGVSTRKFTFAWSDTSRMTISPLVI